MDIRLYTLDKCGFYKRGVKIPEFGAITEWWDEFVQWIGGVRNVAETATFEQSRRMTTQVYCVDTTSDGHGNYGVTLWNRIPSTEEGVAFIDIASTVGNVVADAQDLPGEDTIPGWPAYLWYMPEHETLVSLVPDNMRCFRHTGVPQAREYFLYYLSHHSPRYVAKRRVEDEMTGAVYEIDGYRRSALDDPDPSLTPYFETSPLSFPGLSSDIRKHRTEIRKLVTETPLRTLQPTDTSALDRVLGVLGADTVSRTEDEKAKYRIIMDWQPKTDRELEDLIDTWQQREDKDNHSIGVQFSGSSKIQWLGRIDGRGVVEISNVLSQKRLWKDEEARDAWEQARPEVAAILESSRGQEDIS